MNNRLVAAGSGSWVAVGTVLLAAGWCQGMIVAGGTTGIENNKAPAGLERAWGAVGSIGGASGVYLGNGWVITAQHTGADGIGFSPSDGYYANPDFSYTRLNDPASGKPTDLKLFRITGTPASPGAVLSTSAPRLNQSVTMIGYGGARSQVAGESGLIYYTLSSTDPKTAVWTQVTSADNYDQLGYRIGASVGKLWATNRLSYDPFGPVGNTDVQSILDLGDLGPVPSIYCSFDEEQTNEGLAVSGDSGGGVFDTQTGELIGIIDIWGAEYETQPLNAAIFTNVNSFVDLSKFLPQIGAITGLPVPEPTWGLLVPACAVALRRRRVR